MTKSITVDPTALPTLQSQMFKYFGSFVTGAVIIIFAVLAGGIALTGERTNAISKEGLDAQIDTHLRSSARELSARIALELSAVENGVARYTASIHSQAVDPAFPWDPPTVDYTYAEEPSDDISNVERVANQARSLAYSTHYLPSTVTAASTGQNATIRQSSAMQHMYRQLWDAHPSVVAMYTGYEDSTFRIYPGQNPAELISDYNPTQRGWYIAALATESELVHTAPYVDAFGLGWLITIAQPVRDPTITGLTNVGVTGVDLTIGGLQDSILSVGFFSEASSASMAQVDGLVVADPFWDAAADAAAAYAVPDVGSARLDAINAATAPHIASVHPGLTTTLWAQIADFSSGIRTFSYERGGETYILARSFVPLHPADDPSVPAADVPAAAAAFVPQYVVMVEAKQSDVHATLDDMAERIAASTGELIGIAAAVCFATLALVLGVVYYMSHAVTAPLKGMMEVATAITSSQDIGVASGDIRARTAEIQETNDEIGEFAGHFKRMVNGLDNKEVTRTKASGAEPNALYKRPAACEASGAASSAAPSTAELPWAEGFRNLGLAVE